MRANSSISGSFLVRYSSTGSESAVFQTVADQRQLQVVVINHQDLGATVLGELHDAARHRSSVDSVTIGSVCHKQSMENRAYYTTTPGPRMRFSGNQVET